MSSLVVAHFIVMLLRIWSPVVTYDGIFCESVCVNTIFSRRSSFEDFQLGSKRAPADKIKISLNIMVDNSST